MNKIFVHKPGMSSIVMIVAPTGAYYEDEQVKGISHFLEHMCFKGTKKRTCKQIAYDIEKFGGELNAFTDWELTAYHATIANSYLKTALNVIEDLVCNPTLSQVELDKERNVIIQELKMYEDSPSGKCEFLFHEQLYKSPHGFALPIVGTVKTLKNINRPEMKDYYNKYYNNLTLIVVGAVDDCVDIKTPMPRDIVAPSNYCLNVKPKIVSRADIQQAKIRIGNSTSLEINDDVLPFALDLLAAIYNDMSGRLFTVIREKYNLVYNIHFTYEIYSGGLIHWHVNLGLNKNKIEKARELIIEELSRPVTKKEISDAITKAIGETEMLLDDPGHIAEIMAYQSRRNLSIVKPITRYGVCYRTIADSLVEIQKNMKFQENILVGVVPKNNCKK